MSDACAKILTFGVYKSSNGSGGGQIMCRLAVLQCRKKIGNNVKKIITFRVDSSKTKNEDNLVA
jgi:hypothetical protein